MRNKNLIKDYVLLITITIIIVLLIILFNIVTYGKPSSISEGFPSLGVWKPIEDVAKAINLSDNETLIERRQVETPSTLEVFKETFNQYWLSYVVFLLIILLLVAWVLIVHKIYNG